MWHDGPWLSLFKQGKNLYLEKYVPKDDKEHTVKFKIRRSDVGYNRGTKKEYQDQSDGYFLRKSLRELEDMAKNAEVLSYENGKEILLAKGKIAEEYKSMTKKDYAIFLEKFNRNCKKNEPKS